MNTNINKELFIATLNNLKRVDKENSKNNADVVKNINEYIKSDILNIEDLHYCLGAGIDCYTLIITEKTKNTDFVELLKTEIANKMIEFRTDIAKFGFDGSEELCHGGAIYYNFATKQFLTNEEINNLYGI